MWYQYSYTIVESIVETFSYEKLNEFIRSPHSCLDIFGITISELQKTWIGYLSENYSV